jgi:hypothetical protein
LKYFADSFGLLKAWKRMSVQVTNSFGNTGLQVHR